MDIITLSIPFFFALIGLELLVARVRKRPLYRLSDSISDLSCGILSQLAGILIALLTIAGYSWVQQRWSIQHVLPLPAWSHSPLAWVTVFLLDDLAYYWMHRSSHVVNLLWAGHVVHHSSEEFNLTVALRQSSLHGLMSWLFYLPIALLGVPVTMWLVCHALNLVYQFWIHTREVDRLGPLEWILNTPSHHRVHHASQGSYLDRNFGGVLIIWDRLFGSFAPELERPVYGLTKKQTSPTSPIGFKSKTDPQGAFDYPINPMKKLIAAGATYGALALPLRHQMLELAQAGAQSGTFSLEAYSALSRRFHQRVAVALLLPFVGLGLMVLKPF